MVKSFGIWWRLNCGSASISSPDRKPPMLPERQTSAPQTSSGPRGRVKSVMKHLVRIVLARALYHTGLLTALKRLTHQHSLQVVTGATFPRLGRDRTPKFGILCYHRVGS